MNEVVSWNSRARDATVSVARRIGDIVQSLWDWFTDLGTGAWILGLAVVVGGGILIAMIQGRSGPQESACQQAAPYIDTIQRFEQRTALTQVQSQRLHNTSSQLTALARTAFGDDKHAITDAARLAGSAQAGQPFSAGNTAGEFEGACPTGGFG